MTKLSLEQIEDQIRYWEGVKFASDYCDDFGQANRELRQATSQIQFYEALKREKLNEQSNLS